MKLLFLWSVLLLAVQLEATYNYGGYGGYGSYGGYGGSYNKYSNYGGSYGSNNKYVKEDYSKYNKDKYVYVDKNKDKDKVVIPDKGKNKGFCDLECTNLGVTADGNWIIKVKELSLTFAYNKAVDTLVMINFETKVSVSISKGFFGIFDLDVGSAIILNAESKAGTIVNNIKAKTDLFFKSDVDIILAVKYCSEIVTTSRQSINANLSFNSNFGYYGDRVDFSFQSNFQAQTDIGMVIENSLEFGYDYFIQQCNQANIKLSVNLNMFIKNYFAYYNSNYCDKNLGLYNVIASIISYKSLSFSAALSVSSAFFVKSVKLSSNASFSLFYNLSFFVKAFLDNTIVYPKLYDSTWEFYDTSNTHMFSCNMNGMIIRNGVAVGTMETFASLNWNINFNADISVESSSSLDVQVSFNFSSQTQG